VLKKAFEGELTRRWREPQTDLPDAGGLLEQICKEREGTAKATGKKMKPAKSLTEEELEELPRLPEGWFWVKFSEACNIKSNLVSPEGYKSYPHIAPDNIERETGQLLQYRTIEEDKVFSPKHFFYKGQIIYSKIRPYLNKLIIAPFDGLCSVDMVSN
jgi:type I restriction enzyme, S subunit